jgi:mannose-6-phosphate isomerase-like protein (cupin superfamily)
LAESHARNLGVRRLYLLTTTAEAYFAKRGFERCAREAAPAAIRQTREFRSLCPDTAACMVRTAPEGALHLPAAVLPMRSDIPGAKMWAAALQNTMLTYFEVEPHVRFETHAHDGEQITAVVQGELFFELSQGTVRLGPGDVLAIPAGAPHAVFTGVIGARAFDAWSPPPPRYQSTESARTPKGELTGAATVDADCCGGAPTDASACCVADEQAKKAGEPGCGCGAKDPAEEAPAKACCG